MRLARGPGLIARLLVAFLAASRRTITKHNSNDVVSRVLIGFATIIWQNLFLPIEVDLDSTSDHDNKTAVNNNKPLYNRTDNPFGIQLWDYNNYLFINSENIRYAENPQAFINFSLFEEIINNGAMPPRPSGLPPIADGQTDGTAGPADGTADDDAVSAASRLSRETDQAKNEIRFPIREVPADSSGYEV